MKILLLLLFFTMGFASTSGCSSGSSDCGRVCSRNPANESESSLDVTSIVDSGFYIVTYEVSAQAGDMITVHLTSYDFTTRLQVVFDSSVIAENSQEEADYVVPGDIPYWEVAVETTAAVDGTYTIVVSTTEEGTTGDYTLDWTIGGEEDRDCEAVDCEMVI